MSAEKKYGGRNISEKQQQIHRHTHTAREKQGRQQFVEQMLD